MVLLGRKIRLLMWKNSLLRRKHCWETTGMIMLPVYFIVFMYIVPIIFSTSSFAPSFDRQSRSSKERSAISGRTLQDEFEISDPYDINIGTSTSKIPTLVKFLTGESEATTRDIAYSPSSNKTSLVMKEVLNHIKGDSSGSSKKDKPKDWKPFRVAVNFQDKLEKIEKADRTVGYKIRFVDQDFSTDKLQRNDGHKSDDRYKNWGFTALQVLTDKILIEKMTGGLKNDIKLELQEFPRKVQEKSRKAKDRNVDSVLISTLPFYIYYLQHCIILGFSLYVSNIIRRVVSEKQSGVKELMQIMGVPNWMHWAAWKLESLFIMGISTILMVLVLLFLLFFPVYLFWSTTLWLFVMLLYIMAITSFCLFISTFFSDAFLATSIGTSLYLVSYYGFVFTMDGENYFSTLGEIVVSSLLPNMALHWALQIIFPTREREVDSVRRNIPEPNDKINQLSLLPVCVMLIVDIVLYLILAIYLEKVLPSEFGVRKPWYYIFQRSTWTTEKTRTFVKINRSTAVINPEREGNDVSDHRTGFEEEHLDRAVGIKVCDLTKNFDSHKIAVDGISAKMYVGETTVLFGNNGAGKTTTLFMLAGLLPTSGTVIINGDEITMSMEKNGKNLGVCLKYNILFDELTVEENLEFFGVLRWLSTEEAKVEAEQIILSLKLDEITKVESRNLYEGQKRRLSLANAVIGNPSVLLLDEPTLGLDPENRKEVWDMLSVKTLREGRTIVLATHLMEEANVLGNRIVVMAEGKIQCSGTSLFLKNLYGNGYSIILTTKEVADAQTILSVVQKYISQAFIDVSIEQSSKSEFTITLLDEFTSTSVFPDLFKDLDQKQEELGILMMYCKIATMDDVFVKVGEGSPSAEAQDLEKYEDISNYSNPGAKKIKRGNFFSGLMTKLWIRNIRNMKLIFFQLLPPIIAVIVVCSIASSILREAPMPDYTSLKISMGSYSDSTTICKPMSKEAENMCNTLSVVIPRVHILPVDQKSLIDFLMDESRTNFKKLKTRYVIAAEMTKIGPEMKIKVMHSPYFYLSEPLAINAASNTVLKLLSGYSAKKIEVTNHPLKRITAKIVFDAAEKQFTFYSYKSASLIVGMFCLLIPLGLICLVASYVIFPTQERLSNSKLLQRKAGVSPFLYWTSAFLWDFIMMILMTFIMLLCVFIFQPYKIFTDGYAGGVLFLIFVVYYFSVLPLSYLTSIHCSTEAQGFTKLVIHHADTDGDRIAGCFGLLGGCKEMNTNQEKLQYRHSDRVKGYAANLNPEIVKMVMSLCYAFLASWVTAFVMVFAHDRVPNSQIWQPLPDLILDNIPNWPWAFEGAEIIGMLLFTMLLLVLIVHKHRIKIITRYCLLCGTLFLVRCVTMILTSPSAPGIHLNCQPRPYGTLEVVLKNTFKIWRGGGLSSAGVITCGDYLFSGHTVIITLLSCTIRKYIPGHIWSIRTGCKMLNYVGIFLILSANEHYSIDTVVGYFITTLSFSYYHEMARANGSISNEYEFPFHLSKVSAN